MIRYEFGGDMTITINDLKNILSKWDKNLDLYGLHDKLLMEKHINEMATLIDSAKLATVSDLKEIASSNISDDRIRADRQ